LRHQLDRFALRVVGVFEYRERVRVLARLSNPMGLAGSFVAELREQHPDYFED